MTRADELDILMAAGLGDVDPPDGREFRICPACRKPVIVPQGRETPGCDAHRIAEGKRPRYMAWRRIGISCGTAEGRRAYHQAYYRARRGTENCCKQAGMS